jgi:hypothetical protein
MALNRRAHGCAIGSIAELRKLKESRGIKPKRIFDFRAWPKRFNSFVSHPN